MGKIALALMTIVVVVALGCASGATIVIPTPVPSATQTPGTTVKPGVIAPIWITAQVDGNTVSVPLSEANSGKMIHFEVAVRGSDMAFMAYKYGDKIYVRANVCPPCHSQRFSLIGDILDCNNCHTKFKASTGDGVSGACVNYPKAAVKYSTSGDNITMAMNDLATVYDNTVEPGWP